MHPKHMRMHTHTQASGGGGGERHTDRERERERWGEQTFLSASSLDTLSAVQTIFMPVKYFLLMTDWNSKCPSPSVF